jgi:hypothetical protein
MEKLKGGNMMREHLLLSPEALETTGADLKISGFSTVFFGALSCLVSSLLTLVGLFSLLGASFLGIT